MDTDSPADRIDDEDDDEEPSYNADLLELEPLREDSDDLLDDGNGDDKAQRSSPEDGDENSNEKSSEEDDDDDDEDDDEEEDTHVQGLTSNEREILTLLAVDKVCCHTITVNILRR